MHTVFLVEDEPLIRQNIRKAIEKSAGPYTCIGEAADGELALSMIRDLRPDILITDIKMPFMDGLTLARHAKAIIPWLRIIIVSGYDEFELARQAISVGVDQFILKPVAGPDLTEALERAGEQIMEHKRNRVLLMNEASDEKSMKYALVSTLLEQLCAGEITADETLRRADELGMDILSKRYVVLVTQYEGKGGLPDRQQITSKVKFMLMDETDVLYFFSGLDHLVHIIKGSEDVDVTEKAYHTAQTLKHEIEDDRDTVLTISISSVCVRISAIRDAFHEACILLKTFGETNHGRVFCAGDIDRLENPVTVSDDSFFNLNIENQLKFAINEDVPVIVEGLTRDLTSNEMHSVLYRYYILMDLTNTAIRIIRDFNPDTDPAGIAENFAGLRQVFQSSMSEEEFSELSTKICYKAIELRDSGNSSHHVKIVRRACEYILENFSEPDISLNTVAAHVALSPTHFSTVFSQEMSVTFIEYLTSVRIEKVKEMLASTDEKIVSIAFSVGYNEPNYLSYLFKKREGLTPKEYRQHRGRERGKVATS
ncbi:MAG: response regulator [Spirochaetaceae bacterium]|nr:response regulator [Spirochaetaceae bacterium]